jgi:hypothetical protein
MPAGFYHNEGRTLMDLEQYLNPGEEIIVRQRRHLAPLVSFCVLLLVVLPFFCAFPLLLLFLPAMLPLIPTLGTVYAITNRRVLCVSGLFSRSLQELPLEQAARIEIREPILQRLFGCGQLVFNPVQGNEIEVSPLYLDFLRHPSEFRRRIIEQRELLAHVGMHQALALAAGLQDRAVQALALELRQAAPPAPVKAAVAVRVPQPVVEKGVWYYSRGGKRQGPVSTAELQQLARSGDLIRQDWVWKEGMREWAPAAQIKGLFSAGPMLGTKDSET